MALANADPLSVVEDHDEAGALKTRTGLRGGVPDGRVTTYGAGGQPALEAMYQKGQLHGPVKMFDEAGRLVQEAAYVKGVQHGITRVYDGGRPLSEQAF